MVANLSTLAISLLGMFSMTEAFTMSVRPSSSTGGVHRADFLKQIGVGTAAVATGVAAAPLASVAAGEATPAVGSVAPDFTLPSNTGKDISLKDLLKKAKHTVLYFYPGDYTKGCTIEAEGFQADFDKYVKADAQIVGVSVDSVEQVEQKRLAYCFHNILVTMDTFFRNSGSRLLVKHLNFEKSYNLQFPLLSDIGADVADAYGSTYTIPFGGKLANRLTFIIGSDGKIEKVFKDGQVKVVKHSADVLASLASL